MNYPPLHIMLANASFSHRKKCRIGFQALDLSEGQPKVLSSLLKEDGQVQRDLAGICHVEPATMTSLLQKMEADGLIEKEKIIISGGKRANSIRLTQKGRDQAVAVNEIMNSAEKTAFTDFSAEEKEQFLSLLNRLVHNLNC